MVNIMVAVFENVYEIGFSHKYKNNIINCLSHPCYIKRRPLEAIEVWLHPCCFEILNDVRVAHEVVNWHEPPSLPFVSEDNAINIRFFYDSYDKVCVKAGVMHRWV